MGTMATVAIDAVGCDNCSRSPTAGWVTAEAVLMLITLTCLHGLAKLRRAPCPWTGSTVVTAANGSLHAVDGLVCCLRRQWRGPADEPSNPVSFGFPGGRGEALTTIMHAVAVDAAGHFFQQLG
jgi:hypothetical protein